jgi:hypothetical protein
MEVLEATISDGDKVLLAGVTAWVQMTNSPGGLRGWHGYFTLPLGSFVPPGGPYLFKTTDGRSGQILITNVWMRSDQSTQVQFRGTVPFG